jgi:hypothetical protein
MPEVDRKRQHRERQRNVEENINEFLGKDGRMWKRSSHKKSG